MKNQIELTVGNANTKGKAIKTVMVKEGKDSINIMVFGSVQKVADRIGCNGDKLRKELREAGYLSKGNMLVSYARCLNLKLT